MSNWDDGDDDDFGIDSRRARWASGADRAAARRARSEHRVERARAGRRLAAGDTLDATPAPATPDNATHSGFRRAFALTAAALLVLVGVFSWLGYAQGPKLSDAQVDTAGVVAKGGQQLRLFANQLISPVTDAQVSITPAAPASVTTSGDVLAVQFSRALRYDTEYSVRVTGVTSPYLAQRSTLSYTFRTGAPPLYYLDRGTDTDSIVRTGVTSTDRTVVYSAPGIQEFAVFQRILAVVTTDTNELSTLSLVDETGKVENVQLPGDGTVETLKSDSTTGLLGFTFTSAGAEATRQYTDTLFTTDLTVGRVLKPVAGIDGSPLQVIGWSFVPSAAALVAQNRAESIVRVDETSGAVVPLGQFAQMGAISSDGLTLSVSDQGGPLALTLATGATTRIEPTAVAGETPYGGALALLSDGSRVQQIAVLDDATGRFRSALMLDDGRTSRVLYRTPNDSGSIERFVVSPNDQYVAIESVPNVSDSATDGYPVNPRSTAITTVFVDIASGATVKSVEGFAPSW